MKYALPALVMMTLIFCAAPARAQSDGWYSPPGQSDDAYDNPFERRKPEWYDETDESKDDPAKLVRPRAAIELASPFEKPSGGTLSDIQRRQLETVR